MNAPLLCGSRKCVSYLFQCVGGSYCPFQRPFLCPNMQCKKSQTLCESSYIGGTFDPLIIKYDINKEQIDRLSVKHSFSNGLTQIITLEVFFGALKPSPSGPFQNENLKENAEMRIETVPLDYFRNITNKLNSTLAYVAKSFFLISEADLPYYLTLRSSAINITTKGRLDNNENFYQAFKARFSIDGIRKNENPVNIVQDFLCLGVIDEVGNKWRCVNRKVKGVSNAKERSADISYLEYDIKRPGIYAVIFKPRMTPNLMREGNCGLVCKYKKQIIAISFFILPALLIIFYFIWRYMMLYYKMKDKQIETKAARQKLIELEKVTASFKGQSIREKIAENMDFQQNPLQGKSKNDLGELNQLNNYIEVLEMDLTELNDIKKKLLAKTKKQIKRIGVIRDDIENLGSNRFDQDIGVEYGVDANYL